MSTTFVHVTDFHFLANSVLEKKKIDGMCQVVQNSRADKVVFLIGGDLTFSGEEGQFEVAFEFFRNLSNKLGELQVKTGFVCVPGNHDIQYKKGYTRKRNEIKKLSQKEMIKQFSKETRKFDNFYNFQCKLHSLNDGFGISVEESDASERYLFHYVLHADSVSFDIYALNNAMFSFYDKNEKYMDNEKGIFQILQSNVEKIKRTSEYSILLMHFPFEYFSDNSRKVLLMETRRNIDLVLTGHIHEDYLSYLREDRKDITFLQSGAYSINGKPESSFCLLSIDVRGSKYVQYSWSEAHNCFKQTKNIAIDLIPYNFVFDDMTLNNDFIYDFYHDTQQFSSNFLDYFVFPLLTFRNTYEEVDMESIENYDTFYEMISKNAMFIIEGDETSGKTTLLKYLHKRMISENLVLFAENHDFRKRQKPELFIKNLLQKQYDNVIFDNFLKYNLNQRVLLIDDADGLMPQIESVQPYFGKIILTFSKTSGEPLRNFILRNEFVSEGIIFFEIHRFYKKKRVELAKNIFRAINGKNGDIVSDYQMNKFTSRFNNIIETHLPLFGLNPLNIFFLVFHLSQNKVQEDKNIYDDVFTSNLTLQILKSAEKHGIADHRPYVTATQKIAFSINLEKRNFYRIEDIAKIIGEYNDSYNQKVNVQKYLLVMKDSRILIEPENNKWYFNNKNYLAYYASKEYLYKSNYYEENCTLFEDLLNNLFEGVNDKILLFLAFSQQNDRIINEILERSSSFFEGQSEIKIDKCTILTQSQIEIEKMDLVNDKFRDDQVKHAEEREKQIIQSENSNKFTVFRPNMDDFQKQYLVSNKLIDLVATILPNFSHHLYVNTQQTIVNSLYELPNKFLNWQFSELENHYQEIIDLVFEVIERNVDIHDIEPNKMKKMIENEIINIVRAQILGMYDYVARIAMDISTDEIITSKKNVKNNTNLLQNLMFKSFSNADENFERFKADIIQAYNLNEVKNNPMLRNSIKLIVRRFLMDNKMNVTTVKGINQKFLETFYGSNFREKLLL